MTNLKVIQQKAKRRIVTSSGAGVFIIQEKHDQLVEVVRTGVFGALKKAGFKDVEKESLIEMNSGDETDESVRYPSIIPVKILPIKNSPVLYLSGIIEIPFLNIGIDGDKPSDFFEAGVSGFYGYLYDEDTGRDLKKGEWMGFSCEFTKDWKKIQKFKFV